MKSHLTSQQHKKTRQERAKKIAGWLVSSLGRREDEPSRRGSSEATSSQGRVMDTAEVKAHDAAHGSPCLDMGGDREAQCLAVWEVESAEARMRRKSRSVQQGLWQLRSGLLEQAFSRGSLAFRTFALNDSSNVVGSSLSRLQLDVASTLRFYHAIVEYQAKDFADQFNYDFQATFDILMGLVLRDPIPLATAILITVRHLLLLKGTPPNPRDLYYEEVLRGHLVYKVNAALDDPNRAISDPMLMAVALLAIYEVKYGNIKEYHVHMIGLQQMVAFRQGIEGLNQQTQFIGHFLLWQDMNSSTIAQCDTYFDEPGTTTTELQPKPDSDMFTLQNIHSQKES